jgi:signal transduction histidine kinase
MTRHAQETMHVLAICGTLLAGAIVVLAGITVLRPLRMLEGSARQIARGDLELNLPVRARDEVGQLARAFNDMAAQLREFKRIDHEKLIRTQRTTQLAIDSLPDAVALIEPRGHIELVNETATRLFSLRPGSSVVDLPTPWLSDLHQQGLTAHEPQRASSLAAAVRVDDHGDPRWFLPRTFPIFDEQHRVIGSAVMLADVTELRRLDEIKNHLLATAAHELKTPLTSIRMAMHLIADERVGCLNDRQQSLLVAARDDSDRLHKIVETLLDMDRIRSGAAMLDLKVVSAQELIRQCVEPHEERLDAKGIALRIEVPQQRIAVRADTKRMKHVFGNILDNAIRYTPAGGTVTVSLHGTSGTHAQFSISDTGVGIADDAQMRVFERFYRAPGQSGESGTGLGLAIVREIVEAHGGRVWLESREGRGTTIHFVLPIEDASTLKELDHVSAN